MSAGISLVSTFWTAFLAVLLGCAVIAAAALLNSDRIRAWLATPPVDLDAEDMPRRTWVSEAEARAAHPAGRDLPQKVLCDSCTFTHDRTQVMVAPMGVDSLERPVTAWPCPECGWLNVVPAPARRPVRGEL